MKIYVCKQLKKVLRLTSIDYKIYNQSKNKYEKNLLFIFEFK